MLILTKQRKQDLIISYQLRLVDLKYVRIAIMEGKREKNRGEERSDLVFSFQIIPPLQGFGLLKEEGKNESLRHSLPSCQVIQTRENEYLNLSLFPSPLNSSVQTCC